MTTSNANAKNKIHDRTIQLRRETTAHRLRPRLQVQASDKAQVNATVQRWFIVTLRRSIDVLPRHVKWLLRAVFEYYDWAASDDREQAVKEAAQSICEQFQTGASPSCAQMREIIQKSLRAHRDLVHIDYISVYSEESEARWAASAPGRSYWPVSLGADLPDEPCYFGGPGDFPLSEASPMYRRHRPALTVLSDEEIQPELARLRSTLVRNEKLISRIRKPPSDV
jgi:hypothetical protein